MTAASNPFRDLAARYAGHCGLFVREILRIEPDVWQDALMAAYDRGDRRISARSAHGVGKSSVVAWISVHHMLFRFPQKTVVTAPSSGQLFDALFAEIKASINKLPEPLKALFNPTTDRIVLKAAPEESFISARTARAETPEALQGVHSEHVLLIADEASGIPEAVYEAAVGSMSGHNATTMLLGNPTRTSGLFYRTHTVLREQWTTFHVSAFDSKLVSSDFIEQVKQTYGEDSNAYRVRVLGEFPRSDDDTLIALELAEDAQHRDVEASPVAAVVWGLDVARFGNDKSALCKRRGNVVVEPVRRFTKLDTMQLTGIVKAEWDASGPRDRPAEILVDSIGIGAGVVDRLRELELPVRGINVSEAPAMTERFANLRAQLWWDTREWLARRDSRLPKDDKLIAELTTPKYKFTSGGKIIVESKDDMKRRGLPSPDGADALVLTFASHAATAMLGTRGVSNWKVPIRRGIKGLV